MRYKFPIESKRLFMRLLSNDDTGEWSEFFINNPQLPFVGVTEEKNPMEHSQFWMDRQLKRYEETGLGMLAIIEKSSGKLVGQVGIIERDIEGTLFHEVGYSIIPEKWGLGYASEAAIRMKEYLFDRDIDDKVISIIDVNNMGSQKVAERNGMKRFKTFEFQGSQCYIYRLDRKP